MRFLVLLLARMILVHRKLPLRPLQFNCEVHLRLVNVVVFAKCLESLEAWRKPRDRATGDGIGSGKAAGEDGQEEKEDQMSKGEKEEQFHE